MQRRFNAGHGPAQSSQVLRCGPKVLFGEDPTSLSGPLFWREFPHREFLLFLGTDFVAQSSNML
jgi:hypothetical protein